MASTLIQTLVMILKIRKNFVSSDKKNLLHYMGKVYFIAYTESSGPDVLEKHDFIIDIYKKNGSQSEQ